MQYALLEREKERDREREKAQCAFRASQTRNFLNFFGGKNNLANTVFYKIGHKSAKN
jgi:hypothetical protein